VVVGLAGGADRPGGEDPPGGEEFARVWVRAGVRCPVDYESDTLIAFVAGTDEPEGSLLLSGTGACAIAVKEHVLAARSDGHGWLLGDRGSGFWLGRQAVLAAMAELDGAGPPTALTGLVVESSPHWAYANQRAATPHRTPHRPVVARDLVTTVMSQPPPNLARLAPLVFAACAAADPVAEAIVERAVAHLSTTLSAVREARSTKPIVLAGSILTNPTPVAERVRAVLRERWPEAAVSLGLDGAAAAVRLALDRLKAPPDVAVRERLFSDLPSDDKI
ncbi:MAG: N-acetylglucosamine kinase, partial [Catenulispora sp.]